MENADTFPEAFPRFSQTRESERVIEEPEKRQRIKVWMGGALVITAFTIDLLEFILDWLLVGLVLNPVVLWPVANIVFFIWFKMLDVPFIASPKKFFVLAATSLVEIIPALDAVGGFFWTAGTLIIVLMVRAEDKGGMIGKLSGAAMGLMAQRYNANKAVFSGQVNPRELRKMRPDLVIKKEELMAEATGRRKEYLDNKALNDKLSPNKLDLKNTGETAKKEN